MFLHPSLRHRGLAALAGAIVLATTISPLGIAPTNAARSHAPITLTFWTWVPKLAKVAAVYEQTHPGIKINVVNAGQGTPELTKLRVAFKSGVGAPDVVQLPDPNIPEFVLSGKLVDLAQYGANSVKNQFLPASWGQVSVGSKVYAIPQDTGPMGLLYRKDIFAAYHLAVPTTWAQYAQEALALHKANPKLVMAAFPASEGIEPISMMAQAGAHNFGVNGTTVSFNLTDTNSLRVMNYWAKLWKAGAVQSSPQWTTDWYSGMANGTYATWITAAWGPLFLKGFAAKTSGLWRVARLPQWTAGAHVSSNLGGSTNAVTIQSAHPKEAAAFDLWLNTDPVASKLVVATTQLFPQRLALLNDPGLLGAADPFFGGQHIFSLFAQSLKEAGTIQWSPIQDYVSEQLANNVGAAASGTMSMDSALLKTQSAAIAYARAQGFTVK